MRIPVGIEKVLYLAAVDAGFREALLADRAAALKRPGVDLLDDEAAILKCIPDEQLQVMISQIDPAAHGRKRFMQKVAACAVALAATTAGAGCEKKLSDASTSTDAGKVTQEAAISSGETVKTTDSSVADAGSTGEIVRALTETVKTIGSLATDEGPPLKADRRFVEVDDDEMWSTPASFGSLSRRGTTTSVFINTVQGTGTLDKGATIPAVKGLAPSLGRTLETCLPRKEGFYGSFWLEVVVNKNGKAVSVEFTKHSDKDEKVWRCIRDFMFKQQYPKPKRGKGKINMGMQLLKPEL